MGLYGVPKAALKGLKTFDDFFRVSTESADLPLSWMLADMAALYHKNLIPGIPGVGTTPPGTLTFGEGDYGVALALPVDKTKVLHKGEMVIHWPTFLANLERFMVQGTRGTLSFVYFFSEVFHRRSVTYHALFERRLRQKIVEEVYDVPEQGIRAHKVAFLSEPEREMYEALHTNVINRPDTWALLDAACCAAFSLRLGERTGVPPKNRIVLQKALKKAVCVSAGLSPSECTVFSLAYYTDYVSKLNLTTRSVFAPHLICGPAALKGDLYELFYAFHSRHRHTGIRKLDSTTVAINLKEYLPFRVPSTSYFKSLVTAEAYHDPTWLPLEVFTRWCSLLEGLIADGASLDFRHVLEEWWGPECLAYTFFVDTEALMRRLREAARLENARGNRTQSMRDVLAEASSKPPPLYVLESPELPEDGLKAIKFEVIRRKNGTFWHPPWEIPHIYHYPAASEKRREVLLSENGGISYQGTQLLKGIHYVAAYNKYFYTFKFLRSLSGPEFNPIRDISPLKNWMALHSDLPNRAFKMLVKRGHARKSAKRVMKVAVFGVAWASHEDAAICELYRPQMSEDDKRLLQARCYGRSDAEIAQRASHLRRKLISEGVYDIDRLPLQRYSRKLFDELETLRESGGEPNGQAHPGDQVV